MPQSLNGSEVQSCNTILSFLFAQHAATVSFHGNRHSTILVLYPQRSNLLKKENNCINKENNSVKKGVNFKVLVLTSERKCYEAAVALLIMQVVALITPQYLKILNTNPKLMSILD